MHLTLEVFDSILVNLSIWYNVKVPFHPFACEYPAFHIPFVEKTIFPPLNGLAGLVKSHLTTYVECLFLSLSSVPLVCASVFMPEQQYLIIISL